jgi:hypothetical protein
MKIFWFLNRKMDVSVISRFHDMELPSKKTRDVDIMILKHLTGGTGLDLCLL